MSCRGATRLSFACWLLALWRRSWEQGPSGSTGLEYFTHDKPTVILVTLELIYPRRWRKGRTRFCPHRKLVKLRPHGWGMPCDRLEFSF